MAKAATRQHHKAAPRFGIRNMATRHSPAEIKFFGLWSAAERIVLKKKIRYKARNYDFSFLGYD
jgi:hypothetical protein